MSGFRCQEYEPDDVWNDEIPQSIVCLLTPDTLPIVCLKLVVAIFCCNLLCLNFLTHRTYMRTALADDDSLNFRLASRTRLVGTSKYLQLIAVTSLMFGDGIKVGFAGSQ